MNGQKIERVAVGVLTVGAEQFDHGRFNSMAREWRPINDPLFSLDQNRRMRREIYSFALRDEIIIFLSLSILYFAG